MTTTSATYTTSGSQCICPGTTQNPNTVIISTATASATLGSNLNLVSNQGNSFQVSRPGNYTIRSTIYYQGYFGGARTLIISTTSGLTGAITTIASNTVVSSGSPSSDLAVSASNAVPYSLQIGDTVNFQTSQTSTSALLIDSVTAGNFSFSM